MKKIRLAIVDNDAEYTHRIARFMSRAEGIEVVGTACDGIRALNMVRRTRPDTLVTGLLLKKLDGLSFLQNVVALEKRPIIITCSALNTDAILRSTTSMGVDYMMLKPVSMTKLYERVREFTLWQREAQRDTQMTARRERMELSAPAKTAYEVLGEMGVLPRYQGYAFLVDALHRLERNPDLLRNISKGLYAEVAQAAHTKIPNVEHSIRYAIQLSTMSGESAAAPSNRKFLEEALHRLLGGPR